MPKLITDVVAEGCCDFFFGRPLDANPYSRQHAPDGWTSWQHGWMEARAVEDMRGEEERRRWPRRSWERDPEVRELIDHLLALCVWVKEHEELLSFFHAELERQEKA